MLYSVDSGRQIDVIPHAEEYHACLNRLPESDHAAVCGYLNRLIDTGEIFTSSWIPGADWNGTPFQPLYHACNDDPNAAAKFFGQILWKVMIDRREVWGFGRYEHRECVQIRGLTYFQLGRTP